MVNDRKFVDVICCICADLCDRDHIVVEIVVIILEACKNIKMKEKICKFFYKHGMKKIAHRISPSLVCYWDMRKFMDIFHEGFKKGIGDVVEWEDES